MGELINLNPPKAITDADIPAAIARDSEVTAAVAAHIAAADPHAQYLLQSEGDARYIRKYSQSFKVAPNASQPLISGTATKIIFGTILANVGGQFASSRLTALEAEIWRISTLIEFELPTSGGRHVLFIYKNGNLFKRLLDINSGGGTFFGQTITPLDIPLVAGDYLEIYTTIYTTANNAKIYGDASYETCWWEGSRVG